MVGEFAAEAGKKAGSFFTPSMVSELMGMLTAPRPGDSIYDPTCGSASLLIRTARQAGTRDQGASYVAIPAARKMEATEKRKNSK